MGGNCCKGDSANQRGAGVSNASSAYRRRSRLDAVGEPALCRQADGALHLSVPERAPTFLRRLSDLAVKVGSRTRLLVEIQSASDFQVTWYRNDRRLQEGDRFRLSREGRFCCVDVTAVRVEDAGRWTCAADNQAGRAACSAHLNVLVPKAYKRPEFLEELRALLTEQGTVSLECKVVGVPTPALRWFKDSEEIRAGDVFALTANPDDATSLGTYTCEATNCMGKSYSSSRVHVVGRGSSDGDRRPADSIVCSEPAPIFLQELSDVTLAVGTPLVLRCRIQVPPWPRAVAWYGAGGRAEQGAREDGLGGHELHAPACTWEHAGEWKCVATSEHGRLGISTCKVTVEVPKNYRAPRFMEELKAVLTEEGLVSFECKVVGFPTPQLSWLKDGQELRPGDVYQLTGADSLGSYCCIASNCMGRASSEAQLTLEDIHTQLSPEERGQLAAAGRQPKFQQVLRSQEARVNEDFRFTVKVSSLPEATLLWYRDDQPIDESSRYKITREGKGTCHLDIHQLEFTDQAEWKCVATNDFGHSVTSCFLKLIIPRHFKKPRFLESLRAILSEEGAVNLECKVIGVPQPVLKWYKDGEELKPGDIHRIISGQDGTCCLGTYTCEAQNCMGIAASSASLLGFEDTMKANKVQKKEPEPLLQRNISLSTIHEERTSQMYDTPVGDITLDDKGEISFSFDGKEVSVSLYETPDLTEEEAIQIVEMYADQLSENVTEQNVVELPPLRFVKETSTSGNLLMEAIVIDVSPDYFTSAEDDLRTEADVDDMSIVEELSPVNEPELPKRPPRKKSESAKSGDDFYSLSKERSASKEVKEEETNVASESDPQSFVSAKSSAKIQSNAYQVAATEAAIEKPSFDLPETEDIENKKSKSRKSRRERRGSRGSSRSNSGSEKSLHKSSSSVHIALEEMEESLKKNATLLKMCTVLQSHLQAVEEEVLMQSAQMSSATAANKSLEIIASIAKPLAQLRAIAENLKHSTGSTIISTFQDIKKPLKLLNKSLAVIEKCVEMEGGGHTLVQRTSVCLVETLSKPLHGAFAAIKDIDSILEKNSEDNELKEMNVLLKDMTTALTLSEESIKSANLIRQASEIEKHTLEAQPLSQEEIKDNSIILQNIWKPVLKLQKSLESIKYNIISSDKEAYDSIQDYVMDFISKPIQELQVALETVEQAAVQESHENLYNVNTAVLESIVQPMMQLRNGLDVMNDVERVEVAQDTVDNLISSIYDLKNNLVTVAYQFDVKDLEPFERNQKTIQHIARNLLTMQSNIETAFENNPHLVMDKFDRLQSHLSEILEHAVQLSSFDSVAILEMFIQPTDYLNENFKLIENEGLESFLSCSKNTLDLLQSNISYLAATNTNNELISCFHSTLENIETLVSNVNTSESDVKKVIENSEAVSKDAGDVDTILRDKNDNQTSEPAIQNSFAAVEVHETETFLDRKKEMKDGSEIITETDRKIDTVTQSSFETQSLEEGKNIEISIASVKFNETQIVQDKKKESSELDQRQTALKINEQDSKNNQNSLDTIEIHGNATSLDKVKEFEEISKAEQIYNKNDVQNKNKDTEALQNAQEEKQVEICSSINESAQLLSQIAENIDFKVATLNDDIDGASEKISELSENKNMSYFKQLANVLIEFRDKIGALETTPKDVSESVMPINDLPTTHLVAESLNELHQSLDVVNHELCDNNESMVTDGFSILQTLAQPLYSLHQNLQNFLHDIQSTVDDRPESVNRDLNLANATHQLQSCILEIQNLHVVEPVDEMSTMEDISIIKTSAEPLQIEGEKAIAVSYDAAVENAESWQDETRSAHQALPLLQQLHENLAAMQSPYIIEALDKLSDNESLSSLKTMADCIQELKTSLNTLQPPLRLEDAQDISEKEDISNLKEIAKPLEELKSCLQIVQTEIINSLKNEAFIDDRSIEMLHSLSEPVSLIENNIKSLENSLKDIIINDATEPNVALLQKHAIVDNESQQIDTFNDLTDRTDLSLLKTLAQPIEELKIAVGAVHQQRLWEAYDILEGENTLPKMEDKLAISLQELLNGIVVVQQTMSEDQTKELNQSSTEYVKAIEKPLQELHKCMAVVQQHLVDEPTEDQNSLKDFTYSGTLAASLLSVQKCFAALEEHEILDLSQVSEIETTIGIESEQAKVMIENVLGTHNQLIQDAVKIITDIEQSSASSIDHSEVLSDKMKVIKDYIKQAQMIFREPLETLLLKSFELENILTKAEKSINEFKAGEIDSFIKNDDVKDSIAKSFDQISTSVIRMKDTLSKVNEYNKQVSFIKPINNIKHFVCKMELLSSCGSQEAVSMNTISNSLKEICRTFEFVDSSLNNPENVKSIFEKCFAVEEPLLNLSESTADFICSLKSMKSKQIDDTASDSLHQAFNQLLSTVTAIIKTMSYCDESSSVQKSDILKLLAKSLDSVEIQIPGAKKDKVSETQAKGSQMPEPIRHLQECLAIVQKQLFEHVDEDTLSGEVSLVESYAEPLMELQKELSHIEDQVALEGEESLLTKDNASLIKTVETSIHNLQQSISAMENQNVDMSVACLKLLEEPLLEAGKQMKTLENIDVVQEVKPLMSNTTTVEDVTVQQPSEEIIMVASNQTVIQEKVEQLIDSKNDALQLLANSITDAKLKTDADGVKTSQALSKEETDKSTENIEVNTFEVLKQNLCTLENVLVGENKLSPSLQVLCNNVQNAILSIVPNLNVDSQTVNTDNVQQLETDLKELEIALSLVSEKELSQITEDQATLIDKPVSELKTCLATVISIVTAKVEQSDKPTNDFENQEHSEKYGEVQVQSEIGDTVEKLTTASKMSVLETFAQSLDELRLAVGVVQQQRLWEACDVIEGDNVFPKMEDKLAVSLQELLDGIATVQENLPTIQAETFSNTKDSNVCEVEAESLRELYKCLAVVQSNLVEEPQDDPLTLKDFSYTETLADTLQSVQRCFAALEEHELLDLSLASEMTLPTYIESEQRAKESLDEILNAQQQIIEVVVDIQENILPLDEAHVNERIKVEKIKNMKQMLKIAQNIFREPLQNLILKKDELHEILKETSVQLEEFENNDLNISPNKDENNESVQDSLNNIKTNLVRMNGTLTKINEYHKHVVFAKPINDIKQFALQMETLPIFANPGSNISQELTILESMIVPLREICHKFELADLTLDYPEDATKICVEYKDIEEPLIVISETMNEFINKLESSKHDETEDVDVREASKVLSANVCEILGAINESNGDEIQKCDLLNLISIPLQKIEMHVSDKVEKNKLRQKIVLPKIVKLKDPVHNLQECLAEVQKQLFENTEDDSLSVDASFAESYAQPLVELQQELSYISDQLALDGEVTELTDDNVNLIKVVESKIHHLQENIAAIENQADFNTVQCLKSLETPLSEMEKQVTAVVISIDELNNVKEGEIPKISYESSIDEVVSNVNLKTKQSGTSSKTTLEEDYEEFSIQLKEKSVEDETELTITDKKSKSNKNIESKNETEDNSQDVIDKIDGTLMKQLKTSMDSMVRALSEEVIKTEELSEEKCVQVDKEISNVMDVGNTEDEVYNQKVKYESIDALQADENIVDNLICTIADDINEEHQLEENQVDLIQKNLSRETGQNVEDVSKESQTIYECKGKAEVDLMITSEINKEGDIKNQENEYISNEQDFMSSLCESPPSINAGEICEDEKANLMKENLISELNQNPLENVIAGILTVNEDILLPKEKELSVLSGDTVEEILTCEMEEKEHLQVGEKRNENEQKVQEVRDQQQNEEQSVKKEVSDEIENEMYFENESDIKLKRESVTEKLEGKGTLDLVMADKQKSEEEGKLTVSEPKLLEEEECMGTKTEYIEEQLLLDHEQKPNEEVKSLVKEIKEDDQSQNFNQSNKDEKIFADDSKNQEESSLSKDVQEKNLLNRDSEKIEDQDNAAKGQKIVEEKEVISITQSSDEHNPNEQKEKDIFAQEAKKKEENDLINAGGKDMLETEQKEEEDNNQKVSKDKGKEETEQVIKKQKETDENYRISKKNKEEQNDQEENDKSAADQQEIEQVAKEQKEKGNKDHAIKLEGNDCDPESLEEKEEKGYVAKSDEGQKNLLHEQNEKKEQECLLDKENVKDKNECVGKKQKESLVKEQQENEKITEENLEYEENDRLAKKESEKEERKRLDVQQQQKEDKKQKENEGEEPFAEKQNEIDEKVCDVREQREMEEKDMAQKANEQPKMEEGEIIAKKQKEKGENNSFTKNQKGKEEDQLAEEKQINDEKEILSKEKPIKEDNERKEKEENNQLAKEQKEREERERLENEENKKEWLAREQKEKAEQEGFAKEQQAEKKDEILAKQKLDTEENDRFAKKTEEESLDEEQKKKEEKDCAVEELKQKEKDEKLAEKPQVKEEKAMLAKEKIEEEHNERMAKEQNEEKEKEKLDIEQKEKGDEERLTKEGKPCDAKEETESLAKEHQANDEKEKLAKEKQEKEENEKLADEQNEKKEKERLANERSEDEEKERLTKEQEEKEENERVSKEQEERERLTKEQKEKEEEERLAKEQKIKDEQERLAKEQKEKEEKERLAKEQEENERLAKEQKKKDEKELLGKEQKEKEKKERLVKEQTEKEEKERLAKELKEKEENERLAKEQKEKDGKECLAKEQKEKEEKERLAKEQEEKELLAKEQKEKQENERLAKEQKVKDEKERLAKEQKEKEEKERLAKEQEENERLAKEQKEKDEKELLGKEQKDKEKKERLVKEQTEKEEKERLSKELKEKEENERLAKEQQEKDEKERLAKEQKEKEEKERLAKEQEKKERLAKELKEKEENERLAKEQKEKDEKERLAKEQKKKEEKERLAKEQEEKELLAKEQKEKQENERLAKEQKEKEEKERLAKEEMDEKERLAKEQEEKERLAKEQNKKDEKEHLAKEQEEKERLAKEEKEKEENERLAKEQKEKAEKERFDKTQKEKEEKGRLAKEQEEKERLAKEQKEKQEKDQLVKEQKEKEEKERLAKEEKEKDEKERLAKEQEEKERLAKEQNKKNEKERLSKEQEEKERSAKEEKEENERLAKEQKEKAEKERFAKEQREKEEKGRLAKEQEEKERLAKEQKEKEEKERLAKEQKEKEEKERLAKEQKEKEDKERMAKEQEEKELLAKEQKERKAKKQKEMEENERLAKEQKERDEKERLAKELEEKERLAKEQKEKEEKEQLAEKQKEREEKERVANEQKEKDEKERLAQKQKETEEKEQLAKKQEDMERLAKEQKDKEEKARLAKEQMEKEEKERLAKEQNDTDEKERLAKEQKEREEKERLAKEQKEKDEKERLAKEQKEKKEKERLAKEQEEKERLAKAQKEKQEKERLAKEQKEKDEKERLSKEQEENERLAKEQKEKQEKERLAKEQKEKEEKERFAKEQKDMDEKERLAKDQKEKEEKERLAKEQKEKDEKERLAKEQKEKEEKERLAKEQEENERLAKEQKEKQEKKLLAKEQKEKDEKERLAKELEEKERLAKEQKEKEEKERLAEEQKQKNEKERLAQEQKDQKRLAKKQKEKEEKERLAKEQKEKDEKERLAKEKKEKEEKERLAKEQEEKERLAKEQEEKELLAIEQKEKEEKERLAKELEEKELLAKQLEERKEKKRLAKEQMENELKQKEEEDKLKKQEQIGRENLERKSIETKEVEREERLKAEKKEIEQIVKEKKEHDEKDRNAKEQKNKEETDRIKKETLEKECKERMEKEKREKDEQDRADKERQKKEEKEKHKKQKREKEETERLNQQKLDREEKERLIQEQTLNAENQLLAKERKEKEEKDILDKERREKLEKIRIEEERKDKEEKDRKLKEKEKKDELERVAKEQKHKEESERATKKEKEREDKKRKAREQRENEEKQENERNEIDRLAKEQARKLKRDQIEKDLDDNQKTFNENVKDLRDASLSNVSDKTETVHTLRHSNDLSKQKDYLTVNTSHKTESTRSSAAKSVSDYSAMKKTTPGPRDSKKKPVFCTHLTDRTAVEGSRVKLTCSVLGTPEPSIQWFKNGVLLDDRGKYMTKYHDGLATLEVLNAIASDSADYTCTATNDNGTISSSAKLKVYAGYESSPIPPTFTRSIKDTYHVSEDELVLECRIRGHPPPTISWLKDNTAVTGGGRYQLQYLADGVCRLVVSCPGPSDGGRYTCRAQNPLWSDEISHNVQFAGRDQHIATSPMHYETLRYTKAHFDTRKPYFGSVLSDHAVPAGGTIALQVEIKGSPAQVTWLKGDEPIVQGDGRRVRTFLEHGLHTLALADATEEESGVYTCRAENAFGRADTVAAVRVLPPGALRAGRAACLAARPEQDMTVTEGDDLYITFRVQGDPKPRVIWMKGTRDITTSSRSMKEMSDDYCRLTLTRAAVGDSGTYCIMAKNCYGCDRAFVTVQVRERASLDDHSPGIDSSQYNDISYLRDVPQPISSEPVALDGGSSWVSLTWGRPPSRGAAPVLAYRVDAWLAGAQGGARWAELGTTPINSFDAFNLQSDSDYLFRVTPRNRYGWGQSVQTSTAIPVGRNPRLPEFKDPLPGQLKVLLGGQLSLTCSVEGSPRPVIRWLRDGQEIEDGEEPDGARVSRAGTRCTLRIARTTLEQAGRYACEATNVHGRAATFVRIAVVTDRTIWEADDNLKRRRLDEMCESAPQFTMRLRDRRVQVTYPVRLTCQTSGVPAPFVRWAKDGVPIEPDDRHTFSDSENFHTLELNHAALGDGGLYQATAVNPLGAVSCRCSLTVDKGIRAYVAPEFACGLEPLHRAREGGELRVRALVEAYPSVGVQWHRDGIKLRPSRRALMTLDRDGVVELAVANVTQRDAGVYTVTAANEVGRASSSTRVEVESKGGENQRASAPVLREPGSPYSKEPMFTMKPRSSEAREGDTVIIMCEVVGDPKPEVMWLRDFLKPEYYRDAPTFRRIGAGPEYRLEIPHVRLDHTGAYSVIASNCHGQAKAIISLQIYAKGIDEMDKPAIRTGRVEVLPSISQQLKDLRCCDGDAVTFECRVHGTPAPSVHWDKDGVMISEGGDFIMEVSGDTARLTISSVYPEDEGVYTCVVMNDLGKAYTSSCLIVDVPEEKENILSQQMARPSGLLSAGSTPRSTPCRSPSPSRSPQRQRMSRQRETSTPASARGASRWRQCPPKFFAVPFNRVAERGSTVTFRCAVAGQPTPWVTWDKDGAELPSSTRITIKERDDDRILQITDVTPEDAGLYRVTLDNEVGSVEATARLEVINLRGTPQNITTSAENPPSVRRPLISGSPARGDRYRMTSRISTSSVSSSWYKNGQRLNFTDRVFEIRESDNIILVIDPVEETDSGDYMLVVSNKLGEASTCSRVSVSSKSSSCAPRIEQKLSNLTVFEGRAAELALKVECKGPFSFSWKKNGTVVPDCEVFDHVDYGNGLIALRLEDAYIEDSGEYTCVVENSSGRCKSTCQLNVTESEQPTPVSLELASPPSPLTVYEGDPAEFSVRVSKDLGASVSVVWQICGKMVSKTDKDFKIGSSGCHHWLKVHSAYGTHSGLVRCAVRALGHESRWESTQLNVLPKSCKTKSSESPQKENVVTSTLVKEALSEKTCAEENQSSQEPLYLIDEGNLFDSLYEVHNVIGRGQYGSVKLAVDRATGEKCAAKFVRSVKPKDRELAESELEIMRCLKHPKLIQLIAAFAKYNQIIIVTEYISGGQLFERVSQEDFTLTERDCILFMRQICEGVRFMHAHDIVHLDLKPENIMCLAQDVHDIKIIDFGLARRLVPGEEARALCGTPEFIAPEIVNFDPISKGSDMWSVGVICYILLSGLSPFAGDTVQETYANILHVDYDFEDESFDRLSPEAREFIGALLQKSPSRRRTAEACLQTGWLRASMPAGPAISTAKLRKFVFQSKWQEGRFLRPQKEISSG